MKNKSIKNEIKKTLDCAEKIKKVKSNVYLFDKIKQKLEVA